MVRAPFLCYTTLLFLRMVLPFSAQLEPIVISQIAQTSFY